MSQPPTMLRPRPVRPLEMSMVVSQPGMMGQVDGSEARVEGLEERLGPEREEADGSIEVEYKERNAIDKSGYILKVQCVRLS